MMRALSIAATGMQAQQTNVEVISNNIANVSTTGFKRSIAEFQDLLYQSAGRVGTASSEQGTILPTGVQIGLGVRSSGITRVLTQGTLSQTDNPLNVAIDGRGYFGVQLPNGEIGYTRDGSFNYSSSGQIVTSEGYTVEPAVTVSSTATAVTINQSGQVIETLPTGRIRSGSCSFISSPTRRVSPPWVATTSPRPMRPATLFAVSRRIRGSVRCVKAIWSLRTSMS